MTYHSEGESRIDEPLSESNVTARDRQVGNHFTKRYHDRVSDGTNDGITKKQANRSTVLQGGSCAQKQTGTDDTADTGHIFALVCEVRM